MTDDDDAGEDTFEDAVRSIMGELRGSVDRVREEMDGVADAFGIDPERAKSWVDGFGRWLGSQAEHMSEVVRFPPSFDPDANHTGDPSDPRGDQPFTPSSEEQRPAAAPSGPDPLRGAGPDPLDTPTTDQGRALAALESGRWSVEPGSDMLVGHGEGPGPDDALGLVRELRVRDWITGDGEVTIVGTRALERWLDAEER